MKGGVSDYSEALVLEMAKFSFRLGHFYFCIEICDKYICVK